MALISFAEDQQKENLKIRYLPLNSDSWHDFEELFGSRGACGGCWCMWWRLKRTEFERQKGDGNKQAMKTIVLSGEIPGIIGYDDKKPIAWCSIAPRENFPLLTRSRVLRPIDDNPVWSLVCLFVSKPYRRKGVSSRLLKAAIEFASLKGAKIVEAYPIDTKTDNYPDVFAATGLFSSFIELGFKEKARRSETRPIVRFYIGADDG